MKSAARLITCRIFMIIFVVIVLSSGKSDDPDEVYQSCNMQMKCDQCISADFRCRWCYDNSNSEPRCENPDFRACNKSNILNPSMNIDILQDRPLSDENKILIKPQKIRLQFRPHETVTIPLKFYTTKDHEVDIYFLMDMSYTMKNHTKELARVSSDLVENIRKLTQSLRVGIGSFVDKIILPFGYCKPHEDCSYSLIQQLKLTDNFTQFKEIVSKLLQHSITTNFDDPEGGMDALMQAVVCGNKIGWRKKSRKLIIYCSDAPFHFAGDGQILGIPIPNDGKCHMKDGVYTKVYSQDYPSIDHISQVVHKHKVTVIFAVAGQEHQSLYHILSNSLVGSYVSQLGSKNSTIANIVTKGYKKITSTVEMKADNSNFRVDFKTNCTNGQWIKSKNCSKIKLGEIVDFRAVITAPECPKGNQSQVHKINIHAINSNAQLEIEVKLICKCDCQQKEPNSSICNFNGLLHCGECTCNEGFSGPRCECDHRNKFSVTDCFKENSTVECSDRGSCQCGKCVCHKMASNRKRFYTGTYCECDDYSCPNYNGSLCGGPSRGECKCGLCECQPGYEGKDCHCPTSQETCRSKNNKICNGHGQCECGVCICNKDSDFTGDNCDICPTCHRSCEKSKECVKCWMSKHGGFTECRRLCKNNTILMVDKLVLKESVKDYSTICKVEIDKCITRYQTIIENNMKNVLILKKKECPISNTTVIVISIISGIFLLGLLILIIWKVLTTIFDRKEMARFNEEKARAAWTTQMNPLFISSSTTYENPTWILNR